MSGLFMDRWWAADDVARRLAAVTRPEGVETGFGPKARRLRGLVLVVDHEEECHIVAKYDARPLAPDSPCSEGGHR
jgi:hypothetical protein